MPHLQKRIHSTALKRIQEYPQPSLMSFIKHILIDNKYYEYAHFIDYYVSPIITLQIKSSLNYFFSFSISSSYLS